MGRLRAVCGIMARSLFMLGLSPLLGTTCSLPCCVTKDPLLQISIMNQAAVTLRPLEFMGPATTKHGKRKAGTGGFCIKSYGSCSLPFIHVFIHSLKLLCVLCHLLVGVRV